MNRHNVNRRQQGAVAVTVAIAVVVLMGFAGLVIDSGRLFVSKAELQNAVDACALAASNSLSSQTTTGLTQGATAGQYVAMQHRAVFQRNAVAAPVVTFGTALDDATGNYVAAASVADAKLIRYVKCSATQSSIYNSFMQLFGFQSMTVTATAKASLTPANVACVLPVALCCVNCSAAAAPSFGFTQGQWYEGRISSSNPTSEDMAAAGSFRWVSFPDETVNSNGGGAGASALAERLLNDQCDTGSVGTTVKSAPGQMASLDKYFNTKFGIYSPSLASKSPLATPDPAGFAYLEPNYESVSLPAYNQYKTDRASYTAYQGDSSSGLDTNPATYKNSAQLSTLNPAGISRRLLSMPVVDCSTLTSSNVNVPVKGFACMLALHPIGGNGSSVNVGTKQAVSTGNAQCETALTSDLECGNNNNGKIIPASGNGNCNCSGAVTETGKSGNYTCSGTLVCYTGGTKNLKDLMRLEYIDDGGANSACASSGQPGGTSATGPKVPALVQ